MAGSGGRRKTKAKKKGGGVTAGDRWRRFLGAFAFGEEVDEETTTHLQEIKGILCIGAAIWLWISLASYRYPYGATGRNWGGQAGFYLAEQVYIAIGWSGHLLVFLGASWGVVLVARKRVGLPFLRIVGGVLFLATTALLAELAFGADHPPSNDLPYGPGGWAALELVGTTDGTPAPLVEKFGGPGLWLLLSLGALISFMLATEMAFFPALAAFREWIDERREERGESVAAALAGWARRFAAGLWDFLRGADLELASAPATTAVRGGAAGKKGKAKGKTREAATRTKGKAKKAPEPELFDDEALDEDEFDEELDAVADLEADGSAEEDGDEEWEWEYVDEEDEEDEGEWDEAEADEEEDDEVLIPAKKPGKKKAPKTSTPAKVTQAVAIFEPPTPPPGPWKFPPLDLLEPPAVTSVDDESSIEKQARRLESALSSFRVEASVVGAKVGPAVTLFELEVAQGTRMNKVTQLSQEIAAALRAKSVRIIAPIPGRATIGIEVPNEKRRVVRLSELISQKAYDKKFMALPLFLGMDAEGHAVVEDLARMPHLLIAGTTGSGKSVCINTILASLLLTRTPHDIQLILVDPKMVELQMFANVPHLMLPVVTDMRQATNVLLWAVEKMEGRYELLKDAGVRQLKNYNALGEDGLRERLKDDFNEERTPRYLPHIVIVIDEMADLMMTSKKEAENAITRLAQKSRAVGIHVIVATQRPSTDVITGVLKGNLPTRIAFQVASKVDSRVILDSMGAEKLLGQGDMLYTPPQSSQIRRVQGALVEDHEIQALVDYVSQEAAPNFSQELVQSATGTTQPGKGGGADQDDLWDEAVRVILKSRRGSASLLQRALGIGYTRASRLIDLMTAEGIVGEHKGSKAREVLLSLDDWDEMVGTAAGDEGASDE